MDSAEIFTLIGHYPVALIYLILFIFAFVENIFPPSPGDTFVIIGAVLAGRGMIDPSLVFVITGIGSLASIMLIYQLARIKGRAYFEARQPFAITPQKLRQVNDSFARHGDKIIIVSRFFVGVRTVVIIMAGLARVKPERMLFFSCIGLAIWHGLLIYSGYTLSQNWHKVVHYLAVYNRFALMIVALALTVYLLRKFKKDYGWF